MTNAVTQCIAFHSYKGGTGKTTIAANLAAMLAMKGYNVSLLDLDVYAPSLHAYFDASPRHWINDFLSENSKVGDIMVDMTRAIEGLASTPQLSQPGGKNNNNNSNKGKAGKLLVAFSNPSKEEIYKLEGMGKQTNAQLQLLRKFVQLREELISGFDSDYIIMDTSPGIRYWSINSLAIADTLFLTLKFGELDIDGTRKMASDIYGSFTKFGAKSYLLLNRVMGYCVPHSLTARPHAGSGGGGRAGGDHGESGRKGMIEIPQADDSDFAGMLAREVSMDLISAIPCYCDIQFSRKEYLTGLRYPDHPFAKQLEKLAGARQIKV